MKWAVLHFATFGILAAAALGEALGQQPSGSRGTKSATTALSASGPSLKDTLAWLQDHISALQVSFQRADDHPLVGINESGGFVSLKDSYSPQSMDSCNICIVLNHEELNTASGGYEYRTSDVVRFVIALGDLNDGHVESATMASGNMGSLYFRDSAVSVLILTGRGSAIAGTTTLTITNSNGTTTGGGTFAEPKLVIATQDKDMADRIAKAFTHAASLRRSKEIF
jgi:hypothetical protein